MNGTVAASSRAGAREALRAEWTKLRTVRSTAWSLLALAGVSILFTVIACWESETEGGSPGQPGDSDIVLNSLAGILFGQIAAAVLAVLVITSEYSTRMIRATLAAFPHRRTLIAAKASVVGLVVLVVGIGTSVTCFFAGQRILQSNGFTYENGYPAASLADGETARAVIGSGIYLAGLALFAVGVGTIIRHTAGAITAVLALLMVPVIAIGFLPESIAEQVEKSSLIAAGLAIQQTVESEDNIPLEPWMGFGVIGAYTAVALLLAVWLIARRDA